MLNYLLVNVTDSDNAAVVEKWLNFNGYAYAIKADSSYADIIRQDTITAQYLIYQNHSGDWLCVDRVTEVRWSFRNVQDMVLQLEQLNASYAGIH